MLRYELTDLWRPDGAGGWDPAAVPVLAEIGNRADAQVAIPINGQRTGEATISIADPAAAQARAYRRMLRVFYADEPEPVLWGAASLSDWDEKAGTVKISAVDRSLSLENHFLVYGDQALNSATDADLPNEWNRAVPPNWEGIKMLIDAAQNLAGHQADTYPPLGIADGYHDTDPIADDSELVVKFKRGDPIWHCVQELTPQGGSTDAGLPDVELSPTVSTPGAYAKLNVFARQGDYEPLRGRSYLSPILVHAGWGKDNADARYQEGGHAVTHAHTLSSDAKTRITRANQALATAIGVYVGWDQAGWGPKERNLIALLAMRAQDTLNVSSDVKAIAITPRLGWEYRYLREYMVGSAATVVIVDGELDETVDGRITQVVLKEADQAGNTAELLTVLPSAGADVGADETT